MNGLTWFLFLIKTRNDISLEIIALKFGIDLFIEQNPANQKNRLILSR